MTFHHASSVRIRLGVPNADVNRNWYRGSPENCWPGDEPCLWVQVLPSAPYAFVTQWKSNRLLTDELLVRAQSKALHMRV